MKNQKLKHQKKLLKDRLSVLKANRKNLENIKINKNNELLATAQKAVISSDYAKFKIVGKTKTQLFDSKEKK